MPNHDWRCQLCGEKNPPYTEACRNCNVLASPESAIPEECSTTEEHSTTEERSTTEEWSPKEWLPEVRQENSYLSWGGIDLFSWLESLDIDLSSFFN